jgi:hypothetical protein
MLTKLDTGERRSSFWYFASSRTRKSNGSLRGGKVTAVIPFTEAEVKANGSAGCARIATAEGDGLVGWLSREFPVHDANAITKSSKATVEL